MRVIDLGQGDAAPFATMLLAELGADVIKVEPPATGDPARIRRDAVAEDYRFDYLNRRKRSVTLNLRSRQGRALLLRLVAGADVVVESFPAGMLGKLRLSYRTLKRANPGLVLASITPFGQDGPRRDWCASELVLQAMGGVMESTGFDGEAPLKLAGQQAAYIAGLNAATAILAAVHGVKTQRERGVHLDISIQEALPPHWARHIAQYVYSGAGMLSEGRNMGRQGFPHTAMAADGWLYLLALRAEWEAMACFLGLEQFIAPEWSDADERVRRWDEVAPAFHAAVGSKQKYEWFAAASDAGFTFAPVESALDLLRSPHLAERGFFETALVEDVAVPCAGLPFSHAATTREPNRAPRLGEHSAAVYAGLLGVTEPELHELRQAGVV